MDFNPSYQNTPEEAKNSKKPGLFQRLKESFTAPALRKSKKTVTKLATFFAVQMSALTGVSAAYAEDHHANAPVKSETKTEQTVATEKTENTEVEKTEESAPTPEVTPAPTASEENKTEQDTSEAEISSDTAETSSQEVPAPTPSASPEAISSAAPVSDTEVKKETTEGSTTTSTTQETPTTEATPAPQTSEGTPNAAISTTQYNASTEEAAIPAETPSTELTPAPPASSLPVEVEKQSSPLLDKKEIQGVEHDEILVDDFHTVAGGLTFRDGNPILAIPLVSASTGKYYLMTLKALGSRFEDVNPLFQGVARELDLKDYTDAPAVTHSFLKNIEKRLSATNVTDREKRRIYFALAYANANMTEWKYADSTNTSRIQDTSFTGEMAKQGLADAVSQLRKLAASATPEEKPEAERLLKEAETLIRTAHGVGTLHYHTINENSSKRDFIRRMDEVDYVQSVTRAAEHIEKMTTEFQQGNISRSDLVMTLNLANDILKHQLMVQKGLPARGWYTNDNDASRIGKNDLKDQSLFASQALIRGMSTALTALGTQGSVQQLREVPAVSQQLLELAKLVSTDTYTITEVAGMPKISQPLSAVEIMQITQTLGANAEAVLAKYSPERLALAADTPERLASLRMDFNSTVARYANIQNDSTIGTRLKGLLDKVESTQNGRWSPEDKTALYALYKEAYGATTQQAKDQLFATLKTYAIVDVEDEAVKTIKPFSETGMRVNFGFSDYLVEDENGNEVSTTEHPVLTYQEKRVLYSKLPYDIYVTVTFDLEGTGLITDNPRQSFNVKIPAGKYADVVYTAHISTVREKQPRVEPRMQLQIAQNGLAVPNMNASFGERMLIAAGLGVVVPPVATNQTSEKKEEEKK